MTQASVCWECRARLRRLHSFRQQARRAQEIIRLFADKALATQIETLSTLGVRSQPRCESACHDGLVKVKLEECISQQIELDISIEHIEKFEDNDNTIKTEEPSPDETEFPETNTFQHIETVDTDQQTETLDTDQQTQMLDTNQHLETLTTKETNPELMLSADEEKFIVITMTREEVEKCREEDRNVNRYNKCPIQCSKCITGYYSEDKYKAHMERSHSEAAGPHQCPICAVRFKRADTLAHHHAAHYRRYRCRRCPHHHHRLPTMLLHLADQHGDAPHRCRVCCQEFPKRRNLRYHIEKFHKERPKCTVCGKTFVATSSLKYHMRLHEKTIQSEECPHCGGYYRSLRAHLRTHDPSLASENAYCAECDRQFKNVYLYRRHLIDNVRHRPPDAPMLECTQCDAKFTAKTNLDRHMASRHTKEYPYQCDLCGKGFPRKDRVKHHILEKHEGIPKPKNKICTYCGKGFKSREVLKKHLRIHTGEKPFQCAHCPWRFTQKSTLRTHHKYKHKGLPLEPEGAARDH